MPTPNNHIHDRQRILLQRNVTLLAQATELLDRIDDSTYAVIGGHVRHILDFYQCFLDGVETAHVNYDARRRDEAVERFRNCALARARLLSGRLDRNAAFETDHAVFVRMEDCAEDQCDPYLLSSIGRELQALASHTTHHFALIKILLAGKNVDPGASFGVAASTLRHWNQRTTEAA